MKKNLFILLLAIALIIISSCTRANYPAYSFKNIHAPKHMNIKSLKKKCSKEIVDKKLLS